MCNHDQPSSGWLPLADVLRTSPVPERLGLTAQVPRGPRPSRPARLSATTRTATDKRPCPSCRDEQTTIPQTWKGETVYMWRPCDTCSARWEREDAAIAAGDAAARQAQAERELGDTGLKRIEQFTFDTFDASLLRSRNRSEHPALVARTWLQSIRDRPRGNLQDEQALATALYFYSPGKGRGKTHLAGAIANAAREYGKVVAFLEETSYLERRWSCHISEIEKLTAVPGDRAWLTVIDDLGQRGKATESVADAWYAVINRRWLNAGWTIFTSNLQPHELLEQGTINEATYSRLMHLIRKQVLFFAGDDQRLAS